MHKLWCGCVAELNVDFEIRDAGQSRGKGVFAMRPFSVGDKILAERGVLHLQSLADSQEEDMPEVVKQFEQVPHAVQKAVSSLHPQDIDNISDAILSKRFGPGAIQFKYNCIALGPQPSCGGALFVSVSHFNHACLPNCSRCYLSDQKLCIISADADIAAGEEMTISYTNEYFEAPEEQSRYLQNGWGITCACLACSDPNVGKKLSEVHKMDEEMYELSLQEKEPEAYAVGQRLIAVLNEIRKAGGPHCSRLRSRAHSDMFRICVSRTNPASTLSEARQAIVRAVENKEYYMGGSTPEPAELINARDKYDRIMR